MKNIKIEDAENTPKHISYRKRMNNDKVEHGDKYYDHNFYHTWKHIYRFIEKYVGKSYDSCYSDFLNKFIKGERIFERTKNHLIWQFKEHFSNFNSPYWFSIYDFTIDTDRIIRKHDNKYHKQRNPLYREYIYKYNAPENNWWNYTRKKEFVKLFGEELLEKTYVGLTEEEYQKSIYVAFLKTGKHHDYFFKRIPVGDPVSDENRAKVINERKSKEKKIHRDMEKIYNDFITDNLLSKFSVNKIEQKLKKKLILEKKMEDEMLNNIERDRLGFDEDSFKTPRKFSKNT